MYTARKVGKNGVSRHSKKVKLLEPVDADKINIVRDHYFEGAYLIDLPLDRAPDHAWQDVFDREWRSSRRLWDRKLFIINDKLRLITTPDEIEEKIDWIKQIIQQTNEEIDEYNRTAPIEKQLKKTTKLEEEKTTIETVRTMLKDKLGSSGVR